MLGTKGSRLGAGLPWPARDTSFSSKAEAALRLQDRRGPPGELTPSSQLRITSPANDSEWSLSQSRRSGRLAEAVSGAVEIRGMKILPAGIPGPLA